MTHAPGQLHAVLWDFDGTLADTEQFWIAAEYDLVAELGGTWSDEDAAQLIGRQLTSSARYLLDTIGRTDIPPEWVVEQLVSRVVRTLRAQPIPWMPGARELLAELKAAGIPCALVSASYRVLLEAALTQLPTGSFAAVVSGDEVTNGKPDPEPYLRGAAALGVDPRQCVVLEDSLPGVSSGNAAGALVLGVRHLVDIPAAPNRLLLPALAGFDLRQLRELVADQQASALAAPAP